MLRNHRTSRHPLARGVRRTVLAMGLVVGSVLATAGVASAGVLGHQACVGERGRYTICILITENPQDGRSHHYLVHVGIDVNMSRQDAQNIIDGGGTMTSRLWGSDPFQDDNLKGITRSWVAAGDGGLSAEFDRSISGAVLDEDPEGGDEVFATVDLYVPVSGTTRQFRSENVHHFFFGG
jgi:hypothetical protein